MTQAVTLKHKQEFIELLRDYHLHESAQTLFDNLNLVALSGIAGGGRNTVIKYLVEHDDYYFVVSDTTRPPKLRDGVMEQDGVQYWFRDEEEMLQDLRDGKFLEAELIHDQQVSGTSLRELEYAESVSRTAIADVEFGGANHIAQLDNKAFIVGLLPPTYEEWLRRFRAREQISEPEFLNRLRTAEKVLRNMLEKPYFHIVLNDTVEQCAADIRTVVAGSYSPESEQHARAVAEDMLKKVGDALLLAV